MDVAATKTIDHVISRRGLFRGHLRAAAAWSVAAAILLLLLLMILALLLGLCVERGRVDLLLSPNELIRFETITGLKISGTPHPQQAAATDLDSPPAAIPVFFDEHGILPEVWHSRNVWWGPVISFLFRNVAWTQSNILALIWLLCFGVLMLIARNFCLRQIRTQCHRGSIDAVSSTRRNIHRQVLRLGPEDIDGTGQETAIGLFVGEVETIRRALYESYSRMVRFPLELTMLAIVLLSLDWRMALQWIVPASLVMLLVDTVRHSALNRQHLTEDKCRNELQVLLSSLRNARMTRGLGFEKSEHEQFQKQLDRYHSRLISFARATDIVNYPQSRIVITCVVLLAFLIFLVVSNVLLTRGLLSSDRLTVAEALTFVIAAFLAVPGIRALRSIPEFQHDSRLAADKIYRYLEQIPTVSQAVGAKFLQPITKSLYFENVKYTSPSGRIVLDGVDFKLPVKKTYAIVSIEPIEAKAIALMLPRFIEPQSGRVMFDGEDIAWGTLESLRAETVFVSAADPPFDGTVFENIRGGQMDLTMQQVTEAAKITHAHNFIVKLFNGYETVLSSHEDTLDVGQRFRLNLTRAMVRDPSLLVIEEPGDQLDEDTKAVLPDAYDRICRDRTVIFIPRRMSTVRRTEQIVVLHLGKVAAIGPHSKLVMQSPVYRHWEYILFNEFRNDSDR